MVVFKLLLDLHQLKQADLPHLKQEDLYHLQRSVMDYHHNRLVHRDHNYNRLEHLDHNNPNRLVLLDHNFKVKDQYFNNHSKSKGQGNLKVRLKVSHLSLPLLNGQGNLKQDHLQVLQSDHPHKDSNKDLSNSEQLDLHQQDSKEGLPPLQLDFLYLTQQRSEEHDFKHIVREMR